MRSVSYRSALTGFVFAGLWLVAGAFALWTPVPRALGIYPELFGAWVVLFFLALGISGILLTVAALRGALSTPPGGSGRAMRAAGQPPAWHRPSRPAPRSARRNES
jgi:hypothetical protein